MKSIGISGAPYRIFFIFLANKKQPAENLDWVCAIQPVCRLLQTLVKWHGMHDTLIQSVKHAFAISLDQSEYAILLIIDRHLNRNTFLWKLKYAMLFVMLLLLFVYSIPMSVV